MGESPEKKTMFRQTKYKLFSIELVCGKFDQPCSINLTR